MNFKIFACPFDKRNLGNMMIKPVVLDNDGEEVRKIVEHRPTAQQIANYYNHNKPSTEPEISPTPPTPHPQQCTAIPTTLEEDARIQKTTIFQGHIQFQIDNNQQNLNLPVEFKQATVDPVI